MRTRRGFNLIELVVVVAIMGVLGAVAAPRMSSAADTARHTGTHAQFMALERAIRLYHTDHRVYPVDVYPAVAPPGMTEYIPDAAWRGQSPIGGRWDWNGADRGHGFDDVGVNVSVTWWKLGGADVNAMRAFDAAVDDGSLSSGDYCRKAAALMRPIR